LCDPTPAALNVISGSESDGSSVGSSPTPFVGVTAVDVVGVCGGVVCVGVACVVDSLTAPPHDVTKRSNTKSRANHFNDFNMNYPLNTFSCSPVCFMITQYKFVSQTKENYNIMSNIGLKGQSDKEMAHDRAYCGRTIKFKRI